MVLSRRSALATAGTACLTALVGCLPSSDDGGDDGQPLLDSEPNYRKWFDGVGTHRGTRDHRGQDTVSVDVGAPGDFGFYKFAPTAVAVAPGTTVRWEWTGEGGAHDVEALEGAFDSGDPVRSETETFEHTFEQPAIYKYYCNPHRQQGMRGAVFVALAD